MGLRVVMVEQIFISLSRRSHMLSSDGRVYITGEWIDGRIAKDNKYNDSQPCRSRNATPADLIERLCRALLGASVAENDCMYGA